MYPSVTYSHFEQTGNQTKLQHPDLINTHGNDKALSEYEGKCAHCNYWATSLKKLDYHIKYVCSINKKKYNCFYCDYKTKQNNDLRSHIIRKHSFGEAVIECPHCKFMSLSFLEVQDHVAQKHNKPKKYYYCSHCEFKGLSKNGVEYHEAAKHTHQRNFPCTLCENKYINACGLRNHMLRRHQIKIPFNKRKSRCKKF